MTSSNVNVTDIGDDVKDALKKFRFQKNNTNNALILKVDREKQRVCVDEELEDIQIEDLQEILPSHQPRYIIYSYKLEHPDGRISYPMCFIFYTPRDSQMELQIMYAGGKRAIQGLVDATRCYEARELDELTDSWLKEKLVK